MNVNKKISLKEKIGYALGDGAANIAWRGVATFLFIFYLFRPVSMDFTTWILRLL